MASACASAAAHAHAGLGVTVSLRSIHGYSVEELQVRQPLHREAVGAGSRSLAKVYQLLRH